MELYSANLIDAMRISLITLLNLVKLFSMRFYTLLFALPVLMLTTSAEAQCGAGGPDARTEWHMGYNAALPLGDMGNHANTVQSFDFGGFYRIPSSKGKMDAGFEITAGSYASFTRTQIFGINGVETPTDVCYNSNVNTTAAVFRYNYLQTGFVTAFGSIKAGYAGFNSRIRIEDPNDPDGCKALEDNKLISDHTWLVGARTGANIDMSLFFKKMNDQFFFIQPYVGFVQGGKVDYINVSRTTQDDHSGHGQSTTTPDGGTPLDVRFVNLQTGLQHSHEVARVYTSPMQFFETGISFVIRLF